MKFSNNGKDQVVTIVVGAGEKARAVTATFGSPTPNDARGSKEPAAEVKKPTGPKVTHPIGAKVAMIGGAVIAAGGVGLAFYGLSKVPSVCWYTGFRNWAPDWRCRRCWHMMST